MKKLFAFLLSVALLLSISTAAFAEKDRPTAADKDGYNTNVEEYVNCFEDALKKIWQEITDSELKKIEVEETESSNIYHITLPDLTKTSISLQLYRNDEAPKASETIDSAVMLIMGTGSNEDTYLYLMGASAMIMLVDDEVTSVEEARDVLDEILAAFANGKTYTNGKFEYKLETSKTLGMTIYYLSVTEK